MRPCLLVMTLLGLFTTAGCDEYRAAITPPKSQAKKIASPLVNRVESPDLAKLILKPVYAEMDVSRDPFRPLLLAQFPVKMEEPVSAQPDLADWKWVGVVKMDDAYAVLLKSKNRRGVYRVNDNIQGYTIVSIDEKQVVLDNGSNKIIMKRGDIK